MFITPFIPQSFTRLLRWKLFLLLGSGAFFWWGYSAYQLDHTLNQQIAKRAEVQAKQLAIQPELLAFFQQQNTEQIADWVANVQQVSDADFITVSDKNGIRLAHPISERVGLPVVGGDIQAALESGESYLSTSVGSMGPSVRYIAPIVIDNRVVGMIKVGYLLDTLSIWTFERIQSLLIVGAVLLFLSSWLVKRITDAVKSEMQNLEPWQLKQSLDTHKAVLAGANEGIIATDKRQNIYLINASARKMFQLGDDIALPIQTNQLAFPQLPQLLTKPDFTDKLVESNGLNLVITKVSLEGENSGVVFTIRKQHELQKLSETLSQVSQYVDGLRVARHEHRNKLSTIGGLLQMGKSDKALEMTLALSEQSQKELELLKPLKHQPELSALLLAKLQRAEELKADMTLRIDSDWFPLPSRLSSVQLCAMVGNLLDNSLDAVTEITDFRPRKISIELSELPNELRLQVTNNGPKISRELCKLTEIGMSTKLNTAGNASERGIGLYLVQTILNSCDGYMELDSDEKETAFTLYVPKETYL